MTTPILLNYRGSAGFDDMNAFNARTHVGLKDDMLFRVYLTDQQLYFIKVGGSKIYVLHAKPLSGPEIRRVRRRLR